MHMHIMHNNVHPEAIVKSLITGIDDFHHTVVPELPSDGARFARFPRKLDHAAMQVISSAFPEMMTGDGVL